MTIPTKTGPAYVRPSAVNAIIPGVGAVALIVDGMGVQLEGANAAAVAAALAGVEEPPPPRPLILSSGVRDGA